MRLSAKLIALFLALLTVVSFSCVAESNFDAAHRGNGLEEIVINDSTDPTTLPENVIFDKSNSIITISDGQFASISIELEGGFTLNFEGTVDIYYSESGAAVHLGSNDNVAISGGTVNCHVSDDRVFGIEYEIFSGENFDLTAENLILNVSNSEKPTRLDISHAFKVNDGNINLNGCVITTISMAGAVYAEDGEVHLSDTIVNFAAPEKLEDPFFWAVILAGEGIWSDYPPGDGTVCFKSNLIEHTEWKSDGSVCVIGSYGNANIGPQTEPASDNFDTIVIVSLAVVGFGVALVAAYVFFVRPW